MTFLVVLCEGFTEMDFVQQVLGPYLLSHGTTCHPTLLGKKVKHDNATAPGGVFNYGPVFRHINASLRQYSSGTSFVTTMLDFYAFPRDFPEYDTLMVEADASKRVAAFEKAMFNHSGRNTRFLPYIQLHEFEALIFSKLNELEAEFPDDRHSLDGLRQLAKAVDGLSPEAINQSVDGAPSKRLMKHLRYDKRAMGPRIVKQIGWQQLKKSCPHFGAWLEQLESLGGVK